jgi:hypothetical protein
MSREERERSGKLSERRRNNDEAPIRVEEIRASQESCLCRSHPQARLSIKGTNNLVKRGKKSYVYTLYAKGKS